MTYDLVIRGGTVVDGSGLPRYRGRRGGAAAAASRASAASASAAARRSTRDGLRRRARLHRRPHPHGRPGGLGSPRHLLVLARGDHGGDGQLRLHAGPLPARRAAPRGPQPRAGRGHPGRGHGGGHRLDVGDLRRSTSTRSTRWPKGINYAGYVGHSALRTYAMGERAFSEPATADDLAVMKRELADALAAGAHGLHHVAHAQPRDGRPAARWRAASPTWDEVRELVGVMGELGGGIFEIAGEDTGRDPDRRRDYLGPAARPRGGHRRARHVGHVQLARRAGRLARVLRAAGGDGARPAGACSPRCTAARCRVVLSFETRLPFDRLPEWRELRAGARSTSSGRALRDPGLRRRLRRPRPRPPSTAAGVGAEARNRTTTGCCIMERPHRTAPLGRRAGRASAGVDPVEAMIELAVERDLRCFFVQPLLNENLDHVLEMMRHPHSVVTFSDSGAHVSQIMDSSLQTHVLAYWVRRAPGASPWRRACGCSPSSRRRPGASTTAGLLREGLAADMIVFDPDRVAPEHARGGQRPARGRPAPAAEGRRLPRLHRQRRGRAPRRRAHRRLSRPRAPRPSRRGEVAPTS